MVDLKKLRKENLKLTRQAVKESVSRDLLIIQASNSAEELNTVINMLVNRLREWYGYSNPEFTRVTYSNEEFVAGLFSAKKEAGSMGADFSKQDLDAVLDFAKQIGSLFESRKELLAYIEKSMKEVCPNLCAVAGPDIGAKLLSHAGSLKNLSEMPSSTIQLLGAEKALFRHLHGEGKSPKHGIIVHHELVKAAPLKEKGKAARVIADKLAIAVKVDYFKGAFVGDKLRTDLDKRFKNDKGN
jgi:nucleolar protein 56